MIRGPGTRFRLGNGAKGVRPPPRPANPSQPNSANGPRFSRHPGAQTVCQAEADDRRAENPERNQRGVRQSRPGPSDVSCGRDGLARNTKAQKKGKGVKFPELPDRRCLAAHNVGLYRLQNIIISLSGNHRKQAENLCSFARQCMRFWSELQDRFRNQCEELVRRGGTRFRRKTRTSAYSKERDSSARA